MLTKNILYLFHRVMRLEHHTCRFRMIILYILVNFCVVFHENSHKFLK